MDPKETPPNQKPNKKDDDKSKNDYQIDQKSILHYFSYVRTEE